MGRNEKKPSALERAVQAAVGDGKIFGLSEDPASQAFPTLWEWLSTAYLKGGYVKQPAVVMVRLGPEGVLVTLTDRELGVSLDAACAHLDGAYAALEAALTAATPALKTWGKREPMLRKRPNR